jgi:hypothetical protein
MRATLLHENIFREDEKCGCYNQAPVNKKEQRLLGSL